MKPVRILYLARGGDVAGSQKQLLNLLRRIDRDIYEPIVLCSEGGAFIERLGKIGVETVTYQSFFGWRKMRYIMKRYHFGNELLKQFAQKNIDLVHCSYTWYSQYSLFLAAKLKCSCIVHVRTPVDKKMVKKSGFGCADQLITISRRSSSDLIEAGICPKKINIIFDSIDTTEFRPQPKTTDHFNSNGDFVFGIAGRICPLKYQMEFVQAAHKIAAGNEKAKFVIVGAESDGDYVCKVKKFIHTNNLSGRICFLGRSESMPDVLNNMDVLVSFSGGSVMYEALACGVPVLSAGFTKPRDSVHVVHDYNGVIVHDRNPNAVSRSMEKMLNDQNYLNRLRQNTRTHVLENLTDSVMAQRTQEVYNQLLNHKQ